MVKSVKTNFVFNLIYQVLALVVPLITIPYVSRVLLEESVGLYSYAESIVSYFVLFAGLGSITYAQREIGKNQGDKEKVSQVFWEIFIIRLCASVVALIVYGVVVAIYYTNSLLYIVLCLNIINVILDISWFFWGVENFSVVATINSIIKIASSVLIFIFVKQPSDVTLYVSITCGGVVLGNAVLWLFLIGKIKFVKKIIPFRHLKGILILFISNIAVQVYTVLDKSMIGWFTVSNAENGYYEYAEKIVRIGITLISSLSSVMVSRISSEYSKNNMEAVNYYVYQSIKYTWMIAIPLMLGFIVVADIFVPLYLGEAFMRSALLLKIFSPLVIFVGMANIVGLAFLIPIQKQNVNVLAVSIAAVTNFCLNMFLIPRFYAVGAALASIIAECVGFLIQLCYCFKKKLLSAKRYFLSSVKFVIAGIIMFVSVFVIKKVLQLLPLIKLIIMVGSGVVIYFTVLIVLKETFVLTYLNKILQKLKKQK